MPVSKVVYELVVLTFANELVDHVVLGRRLDGNEVHAVLPALVPGLEPIVLLLVVLGQPVRVKVRVVVVGEMDGS